MRHGMIDQSEYRCEICGAKFTHLKHRGRRPKYCSDKCKIRAIVDNARRRRHMAARKPTQTQYTVTEDGVTRKDFREANTFVTWRGYVPADMRRSS